MKIVIYCRNISDIAGGVKEYSKSIISAVINQISNKDELFIIHNADKKYFKESRNVNELIIKSKNRLICDYFIAPKIINKLSPDVVFFTHNVIPFFIKGKKIVTIHDLAYYLPKFNAYKFLDTLYMKLMIKSSCKRADKIIAVSENTKRDIISLLNIPESKIDAVYEASDKKYKIIKDNKILEKVKKKYNLPNKFILFTGGISPRKNIVRLIKVFNEISNKDIYLVITGGVVKNEN